MLIPFLILVILLLLAVAIWLGWQLRHARRRNQPTFVNGMDHLLALMAINRGRWQERDDQLPPLDVDLAALKQEKVPATASVAKRTIGEDFARKTRALQAEFAGQSRLCFLNGQLIAALRREEPPDIAQQLFFRLWQEEGAFLASKLDTRWLVSSAVTFGQFGQNETQRIAGAAINILFDMMKLYESERLGSGRLPRQAGQKKWAPPPQIFLGLTPVALLRGDLDRILLSRIYELGLADKVMEPLTRELFRRLNESDETVFARMKTLRLRRRRRAKEDKRAS